MSIEARCEAQRAADAAIELLDESVAGDVAYFWQVVRDAALKHVPLKPEQIVAMDAMPQDEADRFGRKPMPFGQYVNSPLFTLPLDYLDWLVGSEESDTFKKDLRRYVLYLNQEIGR